MGRQTSDFVRALRSGLLLLALGILLGACNRSSGDSTPFFPTAALGARSPLAASTATVRAATDAPASPPADGTAQSTPTATGDAPTTTPAATSAGSAAPRGALTRVTMQGQVGVLLDEFPEPMRERVADSLMDQSDEVWRARARRQVRLTRLRLNFRDSDRPGKGQLPLPEPEYWTIELDAAGPARRAIQTHDLVMIDYTLTTTLLTDARSLEEAEPALDDVGGVWEEPFIFPADPDLLLQRTGRACINDAGYPPNSVDSENAWIFYDFTNTNCREYLAFRVGVVDSPLRFERLAWDPALADEVRTGPTPASEAPDLEVVGDDLEDNRIIYRYITEDDCALEEGAVGDSGWRRLLQFEATVHNVGDRPLHIGNTAALADEQNVFQFAPCHDHVHYRHYGSFSLQNEEQLATSKQAFCVQSTDRLSNNEFSPLTHDYSCRFQGIQAGWVDEYVAGLDTQWMDITDLDIPPEGLTVQLGFTSNEDGFLCEGTPLLDDEGQLLWEPTDLTTEDGLPLSRPQCNFVDDWDRNNDAFRDVFLPQTGSFVAAPCSDGEVGPLRNCGFSEVTLEEVDAACVPQQMVSLMLQTDGQGASSSADSPQVLRVCEWSAVLEEGVACTFEDSVANAIVGQQATNITFTCPVVRDAEAVGDGETPQANYTLYTAPVWPEDEALPIVQAE